MIIDLLLFLKNSYCHGEGLPSHHAVAVAGNAVGEVGGDDQAGFGSVAEHLHGLV